MKKDIYKSGIAKGSFPPFPVEGQEVVLTSVFLKNIGPDDRIVLRLEIGWDKPLQWDMGELEIMIRMGAPNGPIVFQSTEACFFFANTKLEHTQSGGQPQQIFYLTVRSPESRARIVGPYFFEGTVYDK